jgi:pyruvate formate lyase activating enzyme
VGGCNFRCPYCHNPELVYKELFADPIDFAEALDYLKKRKDYLEGVVFTGGEPTVQDDLAERILDARSLGYCVKVDTNGSRPEVLNNLISRDLADFIAMDIKAPLEKYDSVACCGVDIGKIRESISLIKSSGVAHEFRTTFDKNLLSDNDLEKIRVLAGDSAFKIQECVYRRETKNTYDISFKEL